MTLLHKLALASLTAVLMTEVSAASLRVFIRAGQKTHGPNQHDHPRFLAEWKSLLTERGVQADGALDFPSPEQLARTDVLVVYAPDGMKIVGQQRADTEAFLGRGGGLVVIHDGVVSGDQAEWARRVQGGAWIWADKKTKWYEGEVGVYLVNRTHPITAGISNFDWRDEVYYDLDMAPDVNVIATSFESVFVIAPQLWTYEKTWPGGTAPYRAFVSLPGHEYAVFNTPHYRVILLRGIAWAGKRSNVDEFCQPTELANLKYPEGGPTAPEKAAAKIGPHPEFSLSLVAAEPLVEKVMSLDWDPRGRLWVAETPEYPNGRTINRNDAVINPDRVLHPERYRSRKEDRPARDRISILEDTDGDGRMDRKQVFYEGLELVTSLVFCRDGVLVAQAPDILWLRDTDGDGRADKVETLFTGFGTSDTHAVINNFRWGMDGWVYSAIGYSAGDPKSGDGTRSFGHIPAGVFRFKADGSALEQVAAGSCNTWGFDFAPDGEAFYTTATCGEHLLHIVMPEKVLARGNVGGVRASAVIPDHQKVFPALRHTRQAYLQIDWVGMFTASAGACVYDGGAWPERFNQMLFHSEPTVNLVHNDVLIPQGATYLARKEAGFEETEFIAGTDPWFRPIHTRVGPDGALYVVDFYNQAVVHNDTRGPARPHLAGATPTGPRIAALAVGRRRSGRLGEDA
jgi:putative membrane-bound dehydrogenase-like protein